ncbi:MAG: molybdopterin-dependent oxidoreductase [Planctomycetes bacterium]|nr:molybdopterin-dependent oxidoreductase [Planctomycetota bacterium]MCW8135594.1 molybdopterin-dependent oxidoreductase [Planctomycetota bacterium]
MIIAGLVGHPVTLSFEQLATLPQIEDVGRLVPGRKGAAVRLHDVLAGARPDTAATHATLASSDGDFTASVPLDEIGNALLVYRLGDQPLPESLGGPVRFLIPDAKACHSGGADTCANVKFLGSITLTAGGRPDTRDEKTPHA